MVSPYINLFNRASDYYVLGSIIGTGTYYTFKKTNQAITNYKEKKKFEAMIKPRLRTFEVRNFSGKLIARQPSTRLLQYKINKRFMKW